MDKDTRNRIQRATQAARRLLEEELSEQLGGVYDIREDGKVAAQAGAHLMEDGHALKVREKLVAAVQHHRDQGLSAVEAVAALQRECAFTTLNRFVALKMLEARGIVQECVSRGAQSGGFREFCGLAPGLSALGDQGYRLYIDSVFDEIGREVRVLFDRRDPASLLWPRRPALEGLLEVLNDVELAEVWGEDETIGWVYQYFNGDDERKEMRAASQAPRNSRELAVRNQFFTPRYVVEFLTDNTLGRTWVEMRRGDTRLVEQCRYLVRRPSEVFLRQREVAPPDDESLPLEQRTVYVPFRAKKDPRELRVLDPACGSGHFLLYSFDLLLAIYEEAWEDPDFASLRKDFATLEALRLALPGLVLRHNLHGVDIDPRAAQIAAMALWMRAQRAWSDFGVRRADRPLVTRTNVVVAEPMPGEADLRREFTASLEPSALGHLVERMFEAMELAGEAGTLLRIEDTLREAIKEAKAAWENRPRALSLFPELDRRKAEQLGVFDVRALPDATFWDDAETKVLAALKTYAERVPGGAGYRRRLFAEDAARGFAFIDVCSKRYDVVLMNPPFGAGCQAADTLLDQMYPSAKGELLSAFVSSGVARGDWTAAIVSSAPFFLPSYAEWRKSILLEKSELWALAELGSKVLDSALVEAICIVLRRPGDCGGFAPTPSIRLTRQTVDEKAGHLKSLVESVASGTVAKDLFYLSKQDLASLPGTPLVYSAATPLARAIREGSDLGTTLADVQQGLSTKNDSRYLRLAWEVGPAHISKTTWSFLAKGGEYRPYYDDLHIVVRAHNRFRELDADIVQKYPYLNGNSGWVLHPDSFYLRPALTYPERTTSGFSPRILPAGCHFSHVGLAIVPKAGVQPELLLAWLLSRPAQLQIELQVGSSDAVDSGSAARHYSIALIGNLAVGDLESMRHLEADLRAACVAARKAFDGDETSRTFRAIEFKSALSLRENCLRRYRKLELSWMAMLDVAAKAGDALEAASGFSRAVLDDIVGPTVWHYDVQSVEFAEINTAYMLSIDKLADMVTIQRGAHRTFSKKTFMADRRLELTCHLFQAPVNVIAKARAQEKALPVGETEVQCRDLVSFCLGTSLGRFDVRVATGERSVPVETDPFAALLPCSPGMLTGTDGLPLAAPPPNYPIAFPTDGILVDDPGHDRDILARIRQVFTILFADHADDRLQEAVSILDPSAKDLRPWLRRTFFDEHIKRYSKSRRKAPIYWCLGTPSGSYSVWIYLHRFNKDTLHRVLNDHVAPKLRYESNKLESLRSEAGPSATPSQRKTLEAQETFVDELRALHAEIERVAPLWDPDLDDGVVINASFLHRLFLHTRSWARECESRWDKLRAGDYDWAHLAMRLWPERVVPKCTEDRSLAIAHNLEEILWHEDDRGKWQPNDVDDATLDQLIRERTSATVKDALKQVAAAPPPARGSRRQATREPKVSKKGTATPTPQADQLSLNIPAPTTTPDPSILDALRAALYDFPDGAGKSDLLTASGIDEAHWQPAIDALLAQGALTRSGQKRGTKYHLVDTSGDEA